MQKTIFAHSFFNRCMGLILAVFVLGLPTQSDALAWDDIKAKARGQTVNWFMWGGFPSTNAYVNGYVAQRVKAQFNVKLR
ncbi:MAG: hypothetical protein PVJ22_09230, partial [Desulfobacterales bacterium]